MEVIVDELKKNNVNIDVETLTEHIQYILNNYRDCYNDSIERLTREQPRADNGLPDTCLPHESYYQRRYSTSSCPFSCPFDKERWKSRREFYTRALFMGSFVGIELMGYNVNNYLKVIVVQLF